jgi:peptide chain release factor 2
VLDHSPGNPKGFKSVVARVSGPTAWRLLSESGIHRLCRVSEFGRGERHTSFASVVFLPVEESDVPRISRSDVRIETFRSGGKGGQHRNKTDSAVRITHLPTGITAQSQEGRSQHANIEAAMRVLESRVGQWHRDGERSTINAARNAHGPAKFGNRKRSYVLQPNRLVKDHETGVRTSDVDRVLGGDLGPFLIVG